MLIWNSSEGVIQLNFHLLSLNSDRFLNFDYRVHDLHMISLIAMRDLKGNYLLA